MSVRALPAPWRLGYRPALDGLRGVAVLLVIAQHAALPFVWNAGWVGVTLFFVLSGFLITTLLLEERDDRGSVSIAAFYRRRAFRLLPVLFLFVIVVGLWMALVGRADRIFHDALPSLLYVANIAQAAGYDNGLLDHTWSLAVEEQFYLLWPLAFGIIVRWRPRTGILVLVGMALIPSLVRFAFAADLDRISWAPDARGDSLIAGCILALVLHRHPLWRPRLLMLIAAALPLAWFSLAGSWSQVATIGVPLITLGSVVLVAHALQTVPWLAWPPLVWIGTISYGVYLWHLPILREGGAQLAARGVPEVVATPILVALTILVAAASYRYVGRPLRAWGRSRQSAPARERLASVTTG